MEDFEQKLSALLQDPAQLQGIFSLAKSLGLGAPPGQTQADPDPPPQQSAPSPQENAPQQPQSPPAGAAADSSAIPVSALLEAGQLDRRQENLLCALKPFLKPERREKIDRAMQIARLTHLAEFALRGQKDQQ